MTTPAMDKLTGLILAEMERRFRAKTRGFLTADGKVRLSKASTTGVLPEGRGGWRDHAHDGTDAQKLAEANTHEDLDTDPASAIHWTREALQDMLALFLVDGNGDPLPYNDGDGTLTVGGASALDDLTNVVISSPQVGHILQFDGSVWRNVSVDAANTEGGLTVGGELLTIGGVPLTVGV